VRTWRTDKVESKGGASWRLVSGRNETRVRLGLGQVSEAQAALAARAMNELEAAGDGDRFLQLWNKDQAAGRMVLLGADLRALRELLPAPAVDHAAMTVSEYFDRVYWPVRGSLLEQERAAEAGDAAAVEAAKAKFNEDYTVAVRTAKEEILYWRHTGHDQTGAPREKRGILDGEIGEVRMRDLDDQLWVRWQRAQTQLTPRSKAIRRNAYSCMLRYAREEGHITFQPEFFRKKGTTKTTRPKSDPLTDVEVGALLEAADPMRRAMWAVGVGMGLRPSELVRMQWEDVHQWTDETRATMLVRGSKTDGSYAVVPMTPLAFRELRAFWVRQGQPTAGHCFTYGGRGVEREPSTPRPFKSYKKSLATDAAAAGIERKVTPYLLRHSFATLAYLLGVEKEVTRRIGRWTDMAMLDEVYCRPRPADLAPLLSRFQLRAG
jgi:integrase